jgi:hypothetical protein
VISTFYRSPLCDISLFFTTFFQTEPTVSRPLLMVFSYYNFAFEKSMFFMLVFNEFCTVSNTDRRFISVKGESINTTQSCIVHRFMCSPIVFSPHSINVENVEGELYSLTMHVEKYIHIHPFML